MVHTETVMQNFGWPEILLCMCGSAATVLAGVAVLIKTMGTGYGGVITALQVQNGDQQVQLTTLKGKVVSMGKALANADKKCDERIAELERGRIENTKAIEETKNTVNALATKVNGGTITPVKDPC